MNADLRVMKFFPKCLTREESDQLAERIEAAISQRGFGLYAVERRSSSEFIGFVGLSEPSFTAPFTPCIEIGWRLAFQHWGEGLGTDAARTVREHAFQELGIFGLVSFTAAANVASRRVMEKLGMTHDEADDFDHPALPEGDPLQRHVLYRISASGARL